MNQKKVESKLNVVLTALLVIFVCLLSFGIGVISGKGWSDRDYKVRHIEQDTHLKMALSERADETPIMEEMSAKEVEILTQRALEEARAQAAFADERDLKDIKDEMIQASLEEGESDDEERDASKSKSQMAQQSSVTSSQKRVVSSVPKAKFAKPSSIEYTVQVAAYKTMSEAENHSQKLIDKGFPAFPVKAIINGQDWYRVSIGSFKTRQQAIKYEQALKKQAVVKNTFVQKIQRL
jgi:cell division protein FtsN